MAVALSPSRPYAVPAPEYATLPAPRALAAGDTALGKLAFGALWIFVFVVPWEESVPLLGGFVISRWVAMAASFLLVLSVLATRQLRRPSAIHLLMLALVAWSAITLFWTIDGTMTETRVGTYAQLLLAAWIMWELATTETRVISMLEAYLFGAAVLAIDTLINYSQGIQAADLSAEQGIVQYHDERYTMYGINANDLALMVALSLPIAIFLMARARSPWLKLFCWIHMGVSLAALFLVGSRGGLIAAGVALLLFPLLMFRMGKIQRVGFLLVCVTGVAVGIHFIPADDWNRLLNTGKEISQGTLTHRTVLWDAGFDVLRSHPWGGVGAGAYATATYKETGRALVAHNTFISVLVETGIPGFLLFLALLGSLCYAAWRFDYLNRCFWAILLATWAIGVSALTWEYRKPTWFLFGVLVAHAYVRRSAASRPAETGAIGNSRGDSLSRIRGQ